MTKAELLTWMHKHTACSGAREWVEESSATTALEMWETCPRADWLLWCAPRIGIEKKLIVYAACQCARTVLHLVKAGEDRPRIAIETAEAWCRDEATIKQVRDAAAAADAAATYVTYVAYASSAAYAAAYSAYSASADASVASAAYSAYSAANADATTNKDKTRAKALAVMADLVRGSISGEVVSAALERKEDG